MKTQIITVFLIVMVIGFAVAFCLLLKTKKGSIFKRLLVYAYTPLAIWSVLYYFVCTSYAGVTLSWVWLWPMIAVFSILRILMLRAEINQKPIIRIPVWLRYTYRVLFVAGVAFFLVIESRIVDAMTADPPSDLEYVIVLGAGMIGNRPSNPLRVRIERAAAYMDENPDTILIASGGRGTDEHISEAECIKRELVERYGIDESRILLEDRSADTIENLEFSKKIIDDPDAYTGIITNGFHEYRAMLIAKHAGYRNVHTVPATTLMPVGIHYIVREFFGVVQCLIKYR